MTFFALVSAYFFIGKTTLSMVASLAAGCLSLLCKETSFLLLPHSRSLFQCRRSENGYWASRDSSSD